MTKLSAQSIIGSRKAVGTGEFFYAVNPVNGQRLEPGFSPATPTDVDAAVQLASDAFSVYGRASGAERGAFLRKIAEKIESIGDELIERAHLEAALPQRRLQGERARTCGQLRMFAQVAEEGSWVCARIDQAQPDRKPAPSPDIRSMLRPLGPVVVFGASNFPLAFSVAGGDTASAFAAGNPVVVKAHPAHPGTSELVGSAIQASIAECGLPEGVFSLLFDSGTQVGVALVKHPMVKAVGFTGSRQAGRALMDLAAGRPEPIPFFGEMSSTNPTFILPGALRERGEAIAAGLHTSFTLGAGQFCTKPGMVFLPQAGEAGGFTKKLHELVNLMQRSLVPPHFWCATPVGKSCSRLLVASKAISLRPYTVQNKTYANSRRSCSDLIAIIENKVGRLVFNGFPTGVEVTHAMVHGGPYPATSDGRSTSVGSQAIFRFARPVCYQGFPDEALPSELRDANPLGIWRMIDGEMTRAANLPVPARKAG